MQDIIDRDLSYICAKLAGEYSTLSDKNLLITGGAGFLGYYLVQAPLFWNKINSDCPPIKLTVYDNYLRGIPEWMTRIREDRNLRFVKHDIRDPLPDEAGDFDYIVHAASVASPTYYRLHPIETMDANVNGVRHLLDYCLRSKDGARPVRGFLFFSSSEIYGDPTSGNIPTPESYRGNVSCTGPRSCYDESKRYGETLCVNYAHKYKLPIRIARPFNNYGPGLDINDRRVLPDFVRDVLSGKDIVMYSDGKSTRTFCYVADAIVGYYKILTRGRDGEAYNIGVEEPEITIGELANRVVAVAKEAFSYKGAVVQQVSDDEDYLVDSPSRRCPRIDKARSELGYSPQVSLDEGLQRSIHWYKNNLYTVRNK